jgi:enamine deaminase RidA (YjgF/YER057c/UK114 family)
MKRRLNVSSGSPYEPRIGMSRAVRIGSFVAISGTAPLGPDGRTVCVGDPTGQARRCLEIAAAALAEAGASLADVIRTRTLLTRIEDWEAVAGVHGEFFRDIRPASTVMQVSRFVDPTWLVEFEIDAVLPSIRSRNAHPPMKKKPNESVEPTVPSGRGSS